MKLMDMYQNSRNKMLAAPGQRAILYGSSKENFMVDKYMDSYEMHKEQNVEEGRYFMNYFYDIDQSNIEEIKDYLHGGAGNWLIGAGFAVQLMFPGFIAKYLYHKSNLDFFSKILVIS